MNFRCEGETEKERSENCHHADDNDDDYEARAMLMTRRYDDDDDARWECLIAESIFCVWSSCRTRDFLMSLIFQSEINFY